MKGATRPARIFRLGRLPDPWVWPDWAYAGRDHTFASRFDDPFGTYRVLYGSTQRLAVFVECLAAFRPDPAVIAGLAAIDGDGADEEPAPAGSVPAEWITFRCVGRGRPLGRYVDLGHHETVAELRTAMAAAVVHHGIGDLDAAAIRLRAPRAFTQAVSRYIFERSDGATRRWDGIRYGSRYGDDLVNWAIFEPTSPADQQVELFGAADGDLAAALALHGLVLR